MSETTIDIRAEGDIVTAREACRDMARELQFGLADQTRLATVISELARNVIQYAGEGFCTVADESDASMIRLRVVVEDHGPGISDIHEAMTPGFTTGNGLGAGLPGAKRLVEEFDIESEPGHTKVSLVMFRRRS